LAKVFGSMDLRRAPFSGRLFKEPRIDVSPYAPWGYVDSTRRWLFMPPPHFFLFLIDARSLVCVQLYYCTPVHYYTNAILIFD
jgi:hypothetical protein